MTNRPVLWYFETSAVNYLATKLRVEEAMATRPLQEVKGRKWLISPVVIAELLLNSKDERREELVMLSQQLFHRELLPSPEEFLTRYVDDGCPMMERPRPLISASSLAAVWRDLCDTPEKTFVFSKESQRKRALWIAGLTKDLHRVTRNRPIALSRYGSDISIDLTLSHLARSLRPPSSDPEELEEQLVVRKLGIFYTLLVLCAGLGPDPETIQKWWRPKGISGVLDRLFYLLKHHEQVTYRGPIAWMAHMTEVQCRSEYSRGIFWDSLHSMYVTYVDRFFSEDRHFRELSESVGGHLNALRFARLSEMEWTFHPRSIPAPGSFIKT